MKDDDRRMSAVNAAGAAGALLVMAAVLLDIWMGNGGPDLTVLAYVLLGLAVVAVAWQTVLLVRPLRRRGSPGKHSVERSG
jgi:fatty acid desaturase